MSYIDFDEIETISRRHRKLGEVIADLTKQQKDLAERFESLVPVGYEAEVDGELVYRKPPNRAFSLTIGVELCRQLGYQVKQKWEYDAEDAKKVLKAAGRLDEAMLPGAGKERVKL